MPDSNTSQTRYAMPTTTKPWYQRAIELATPWRTISKSSSTNNTNHDNNINIWKSTDMISPNSNNKCGSEKLRKSSSMKVASYSLTRVCLCAPISSYNEVFRANHHQHFIPPRRSNSYPRSSTTNPSTSTSTNTNTNSNTNNSFDHHQVIRRTHSARHSTDQVRRVFRGKSLTDDVLMRRFVVEEEAMLQHRRRNQMEVIRNRNSNRRKRLGPSPLSRMNSDLFSPSVALSQSPNKKKSCKVN